MATIRDFAPSLQALALVGVIAVIGAEPASAEEKGRSWGIGSAAGGGVVGVVATGGGITLGGIGGALELPTLELAFFLDSGSSIELTVPLLNIAIVNAITLGAGVGVFSAAVFYNLNIGDGSTKFLLGPGLGFSILIASSATAITGRVPVIIGVEFLFGLVGLRLMARPWFEIGGGFGGGASAVAVGGGALAEIGVMFYP